MKEDVLITSNLKGQELNTLLIIGKTGTGKSSLCNRIAGHNLNKEIFEVSAGTSGCTQKTRFGIANFGGNKERMVALIDTIGFDDPNNDVDAVIITELVNKLKNNCDFVNLFGIAVNGQNPRLDHSLIAMIKIFEKMFGDRFWKQCVLIFTRISMDKKNKRKREERQGKDEDWAENYVRGVEEKFPNAAGGLKYLYLDADLDETDDLEKKAFDKSMEELYQQLNNAPWLPTTKVNEKVSSENAKLRARLEKLEHSKTRFQDSSWWPSGCRVVYETEGGRPSDDEVKSLINDYGPESIVEWTNEVFKALRKVWVPNGQGGPVGPIYGEGLSYVIGDFANSRTTYYRDDNPYKDDLPGPANRFTRVLNQASST